MVINENLNMFIILMFYYFSINQEELENLLIPLIEINGGRKPHIVRYQIYCKLNSLVENRGSIFEKCYPISLPLAHKMLIFLYKFPSSFGQWDPIKVIFLNNAKIFLESNTFKEYISHTNIMRQYHVIPVILNENYITESKLHHYNTYTKYSKHL